MSQLNNKIEALNSLDTGISNLALSIMKSGNGGIFHLDFLYLAAINRSKSNVSAFISLIQSENYLAAVTFVRMQLDSVLRLHATHLVSDPQEFAKKVLEGFEVRKMKDRHGNKMTDAYLVEHYMKKEPWIKQVYSSGSGFIHLSNKHIFSYLQEMKDSGEFKIIIGPAQPHIDEEHKLNATDAMSHATQLLGNFCAGWLNTKSKISSPHPKKSSSPND